MTCQSCRHFQQKMTFLGFKFHCKLYRKTVDPMFRCVDFSWRKVKEG